MKNPIRRTVAAILAVAAVSVPLRSTPVLSELNAKSITASAAQAGGTIKSGNWSRYDRTYIDNVQQCNIKYRLTGSGAVITGCETFKADTAVLIPKQLDGKDVIKVDAEAFKGQANITRVEFYGLDGSVYGYNSAPDNSTYLVAKINSGNCAVTEIGESAFEDCINLENVYINCKDLTVKDYAFSGCVKLWDFNSYDYYDFSIVRHFKSIGDYAFSNTGFRTLNNIEWESIGTRVFDSCAKLESVDLNVSKIPNRCFQKCGALTNVKIKADSVGEYCFSRAYNLKSAELDVPRIGGYAFANLPKLDDLVLKNTVSIGKHAFEYCTGLRFVAFPDTIESFSELAFHGDTNLRMPVIFERKNNKRLYIGIAAFNTTGINAVVLSGNNISVDDYAFFQCDLKSAYIDGNVELDQYSIGYINRNDLSSGFAIYGTADSNQYAAKEGIPYLKADGEVGYKKIINDNKYYFNGMRRFHNESGSCAGIVMTQLMYMTGKIDIYDYIPREYNGKQVRGLIDVPQKAGHDECRDEYPEFSKLADLINDVHHNQMDYRNTNYRFKLNSENLPVYAKLTDCGISYPCLLDITSHYHAVLFLGVQKLDKPVKFPDAYKDPETEYDYKLIISDNGYKYRLDENGYPIATGYDNKTDDNTLISADLIQIYVRSSDGKCYYRRYDDKINVDDEEKKKNYDKKRIYLSNLELYPAETVKNYK